MTNQTKSRFSLGGSPRGLSNPRFCSLTLVAMFVACGASSGIAQQQSAANTQTQTTAANAQQQPAGTNPQQPAAAQAAKKAPETKPAAPPEGKTVGSYRVHQMVELGGRIVE